MAKYQTKLVLNDKPFRNRQEAFSWLLENGHKVAKSTFYSSCNDGRPTINSDGTLDRNNVLLYAHSLDKSVVANSDYQERKEKAECERAEYEARIASVKADHAERKLSKEWCHAEECWTIVAAVMGDLYQTLQHKARADAHAVISVVSGNQTRQAHLAPVLESLIDKAFNEVGMKERIECVFYVEDDVGKVEDKHIEIE